MLYAVGLLACFQFRTPDVIMRDHLYPSRCQFLTLLYLQWELTLDSCLSESDKLIAFLLLHPAEHSSSRVGDNLFAFSGSEPANDHTFFITLHSLNNKC